MRLLFVTSEVATLYKNGGLADVSYALPLALQKAGVDVTIALPYYQDINLTSPEAVGKLAVTFDGKREIVFVFRSRLADSNVHILLFRHPRLDAYGGVERNWNFVFFSQAVSQLVLYAPYFMHETYDVMHCHDWHTGLVPLILEDRKKIGKDDETIQSIATKSVYTVHNHLFEGMLPHHVIEKLGLPDDRATVIAGKKGERLVSLFGEGVRYADMVTTVSPTYAKELERGQYKNDTAHLFTKRDRIHGIVNGIDVDRWDPKSDREIAAPFDRRSISKGKEKNKQALLKALHVSRDLSVPLFGFIGRLSWEQKGIDIMLEAIERLAETTSFHVAILGLGNPGTVNAIKKTAKKYRSHVRFIHAFDKTLARQIYAGSDMLLVPSAYEPCGLVQMIAMRYGTLPVVRKTGGLADTVRDGMNGFVFARYAGSSLARSMKHAMRVRETMPKSWDGMRRRAMGEDFSWDTSAKEYVKLYKKLLKRGQ